MCASPAECWKVFFTATASMQINLQKVNAVETHPKPQFTILYAPAILPKVLPRGTLGDCDRFRVLRVFCSRQLSLSRTPALFWEACYDLAEP